MRKPIQFLFAVAAMVSLAFVTPQADLRPMLVVIDAGHGGNDFGAKHNEHLEKDITEQIAARIKAMSTNSDIEIHFTRDGDESKDLITRTAFINKMQPDLVLSLHVNANENAAKSGIDLYSAKEGPAAERSAEIAKKLKGKLESANNLKVNGIQTAPFHILKNSKAPAILVELGYITNDADLSYLTDESQQQKLAETLLEFIAEL